MVAFSPGAALGYFCENRSSPQRRVGATMAAVWGKSAASFDIVYSTMQESRGSHLAIESRGHFRDFTFSFRSIAEITQIRKVNVRTPVRENYRALRAHKPQQQT